MNKVERALLRTRKTLSEVYDELDLVEEVTEIEQCTNCSFWTKKKLLKEDEDKNLVCNVCLDIFGF